MSLEIKVFLCNPQTDDNLCFHAAINSETDYDIFIDLNHAYEPLMIEALKGNLQQELMDKETCTIETYEINEESYIQNIEKFLEYLNLFYGLITVQQEFELQSLIGVRLVGAGFRGAQDKPMLEESQFKAMHSMHSIRKKLFPPANNSNYQGDDIFLKKAHGSLILTLEATKLYTEQISFMRTIYNDIEQRNIDPYQFDNQLDIERYQSIIKQLHELNKLQNLQNFYLIINGVEYPITQTVYLKEQATTIYNQNITLIGTYDSYNRSTNSFEITTTSHGKRYCHLESLSMRNYERYSSILDLLSTINIFDKAPTKLEITGKMIGPQTVDIDTVSLHP